VGTVEVELVEVGLSAVIIGASERAKAGRQHSSRIESWAGSTQPFEFGRPP
jgi:hypothetical protein